MEENQKNVNHVETVNEPVKTPDILCNGIVVNCLRLNIRKAPGFAADIIGTLAAGEFVEIELTHSTNKFYKVTTVDGLSGYCMKAYIMK